MSKRKELQDWLQDKPKQLEWAWNYLRKKGLAVPPSGWNYGVALEWIADLPLEEEGLRKMRLAWNVYSSKANRKRKTYSFTLSSEAARQLKSMAGRKPLSSAIEEMLTDITQVKISVGEKVKKKIFFDHLKKKDAFVSLHRVMENWWELTDVLMTEWARQQVLLEANGLNAATDLTEELSHKARHIHDDREKPFLELLARQKKALTVYEDIPFPPFMSRHPDTGS